MPKPRRLLAAVLLGALAGSMPLLWTLPGLANGVAADAEALQSIAAEAAGRMDAAAHARIRGPQDASGADFLGQRAVLLDIQHSHDLASPVYSLRPTPDGDTEFVVMTNPAPFVGDRYMLRPDMEPLVTGSAQRAATGLYGDDHGWWISGYAALRDPQGRLEAIISVDRASTDLAASRRRAWLWAGLMALLGAILGAAIDPSRLRSLGPLRLFRQLALGSLRARIGLAGGAAVLVAVSTLSALDHVAASQELVESRTLELVQAVQLGVLLVDPALQTAVAQQNRADIPEFLALRARLRKVQEAAGLQSPLYTLRRDGEVLRFVGMTNETPFVGDSYELRPGVAATLNGAGVGTDGPYRDAHGTWISAWAPIADDQGHVIGVLQADHDVAAAMMALTNRTMQRGIFALVGVLVAFLASWFLARSIARPVRQVAEAARQVGKGELEIELPIDRLDEVGELARAVSQMAHGLKERERMRDMFGKYMATQVVQDLLEHGEVALTGELRDVTVLITDIRGYTALTETLGATEVVGLLNEYFSILVDVVVRHEGVIDKFMGDALLCWFGAPVPHADHAARAVAAADEMQRRTAIWNARRVQRGLAPVGTGIGIATGSVVVGNIGCAQRLEYTAIGDAVNLASRLCGQAAAGEILVSDPVAQAVAASFEDLGPVIVKGVREAVGVHRRASAVVAPAADPR